MADNFRSAYYKKVIPSVDVNKLLTAILEQDPIDVERLAIFIMRYLVDVPSPAPTNSLEGTSVDNSSDVLNLTAPDRVILWRYVLGITPLHTLAVKFCEEQLVEHYDDLYLATQRIHPELFDKNERAPMDTELLSAQTAMTVEFSTSPVFQHLQFSTSSESSKSTSTPSSKTSSMLSAITNPPIAASALTKTLPPSVPDSTTTFVSESQAAKILVAMYLLQRSEGPPINDKEYELLCFKCNFFGNFAPHSRDWFWLFTFFSQQMQTVYPANATTYTNQMIQILKQEDPSLYDRHFAKLAKVHFESLERCWFNECYFDTFPPSLSSVLLNVFIADTSGIWSVLGLSMAIVMKPYLPKTNPSDVFDFLCKPDSFLAEKHWGKIITLALKLRKKYRKTLLVAEE